jgi:hypothetical protein
MALCLPRLPSDRYINEARALDASSLMAVFEYRNVPLSKGFDRIPTDAETVDRAVARMLRKNDERRVYFAHPQPLYGTDQEKADIAAIERSLHGARVVNPGDLGDIKIRDMGFYLDMVQECDALVFVRLNGKILGGVGLEVEFAFNSGKEVYELDGGKLVRINAVPEYLDREDTVALLKELGFRK